MTLILSGTDGLSDVDGTAATPAIRGTDTNTGIFFPAADTIAFSEGGTEAMRIDSSGNVNIGTSSGTSGGFNPRLIVKQAGDTAGYQGIQVEGSGADVVGLFGYQSASDSLNIGVSYRSTAGFKPITFSTSGSEQARITAAGLFQFNSGYGSVATAYGCRAWVNFNGTGTVAIRASGNVTSITDNGTGDYTVNFTNAMPDANYAPVFGSSNAASGTGRDQNIGVKNNVAPTTTALRIQVFEPNTGNVDSLYTNVGIFR